MSSSRRTFLAASGLAACGLPGLRGVAWAGPPTSRQPAPAWAPPMADGGARQIAEGQLVTDEPLARAALDAATQAGASYADVRLVLWRREQISVRDDHVSGLGQREDYGLGVRVLVDGAWGFAA